MDIFRALGIILMILGHIGFGNHFDKFIHAFHMPMFFFISGFFYKKKSLGTRAFVKRKLHTLILPYISFGVFHYLISLQHELTIKPLLHILSINTIGLPIAGALWFLTALFFTEIIYYTLDKFGKKYLIIILALVGSFIDRVLQYQLPWALSAAFVGVGLYWCGSYVRENEMKLKTVLNLRCWQIIIVGIVTFFSIFINGYVNMREGKYGFFPIFWMNAILSCFVGISLSKKNRKQWSDSCC